MKISQRTLAFLCGLVCVVCLSVLITTIFNPCVNIARQYKTVLHDSQLNWNKNNELSPKNRAHLLNLIDNATQCTNRTTTLAGFFPNFILRKTPETFQLIVKNRADVLRLLDTSKTILNEYDQLTGTDNQDIHQYLVLFQNNMELRPSGGFLGSYGLVEFQHGKLLRSEVQDIYVPDGQLVGHVEPPRPIQEAFQQGFWKLRDANWHPDFPTSAENTLWFFSQAEKRNAPVHIDGVLAMNYTTFEKFFELVGPVFLPDYQLTITDKNLYSFLQNEVEEGFFPGSTKKRDVLQQLSTHTMQTVKEHTPNTFLRMLLLGVAELDEKEIQIYTKNEKIESFVQTQHWDGRLLNTDCGEQCFADYFSINEANVGVNKSNCCVQRTVHIDKKVHSDTVETTLRIEYQNTEAANSIKKLSGQYKAFVRLYLPKNTALQSMKVDNQSYQEFIQEQLSSHSLSEITSANISDGVVNGLQEYGFWIVVPVGHTAMVDMQFSTMTDQTTTYQFTIQKQSGTTDKFNDFTVTVNDEQLLHDNLKHDLLLLPTYH